MFGILWNRETFKSARIVHSLQLHITSEIPVCYLRRRVGVSAGSFSSRGWFMLAKCESRRQPTFLTWLSLFFPITPIGCRSRWCFVLLPVAERRRRTYETLYEWIYIYNGIRAWRCALFGVQHIFMCVSDACVQCNAWAISWSTVATLTVAAEREVANLFIRTKVSSCLWRNSFERVFEYTISCVFCIHVLSKFLLVCLFCILCTFLFLKLTCCSFVSFSGWTWLLLPVEMRS